MTNKDSFKLINKLVDSILLDRGFLDQDVGNNVSILEALIQSGLGEHLKRFPKEGVDSSVSKCVRAIGVVCSNAPAVLLERLGRRVYHNVLVGVLVKFFRYDDRKLANEVSGLVVQVINIVATRLRSFRARRSLTRYIVDDLAAQYVVASLGSVGDESCLADLLVAVECLNVVYDRRAAALLVVSGAFEPKTIKLSRQIWYILCSVAVAAEQTAVLKQRFLESCFKACFALAAVLYSRLAICYEFANDLLCSLVSSSVPTSIQHTLAVLLLELYYRCLGAGMCLLFSSSIGFSSLLLLQTANQTAYDRSLLQTVYFILCCDQSHTNVAVFLAKSFGVLASKFDDPYLDLLREKITEARENNYMLATVPEMLDVVDFDCRLEKRAICEYKDKNNYLEQWVGNVESVLRENSRSNTSTTTLRLIQAIGHCACLYLGHYDFHKQVCISCEGYIDHSDRKMLSQHPLMLRLVSVLISHFVQNQTVTSDVILTTNLLLTLRKVFVKYTLPTITTTEPLFRFLCNCLHSKKRDVRIFAGKIFPLYLVSEDSRNELSSNCSHILRFLDELVIDKASYLAESKILVWGELVLVLEGEVLNVVLVKLLDYFSSSNSFHTCAAYATLINVANLKNVTCWQLLEPFLPNLSLTLVKQITNRSIFGSIIPEFLNVSGNDILFRTIPYTLPYLLTYYSRDIIKEIALVAKVPKHKLVTQELAKILAVLLTSPEYLDFDDANTPLVNPNKIMEILAIVDPYFKHRSIVDLIEPVHDIWEICKMYSLDENNDLKIKNAIIYIIKLERSKKGTKTLHNKYNLSQGHNDNDEKILHDCFRGSLLGIVQLFSDVVKDTKGRTPYVEKLRSLTAIEFLVQISGVEIVTALPQICISLQKTISDPLLELQSLRCWKHLISNLKDIHLSTCFDLIIAIILQRWRHFGKSSRDIAKKILVELFNKDQLIQDKYFNYYFTLSFNEGLLDVYYKANKILHKKNAKDAVNSQSMVLNLLYDITRRCGNDNKYVVQQALTDLSNFLAQYKEEFHSSFIQKKHFVKFLPVLVDILLKNCQKFKPTDEINIPKDCARCLGLVGLLDPSKFEFHDEERELVCDFNNVQELLQFTVQLLNLLVKAFWASEDPGKQIFLAYGMQEFLKLCEIHDLSAVPIFNDLTISTLTPLITSRYELSSMGNRRFTYPMFKLTKNHSEWVRDFTLDLLQKSRQSCLTTESDRYETTFYYIYETIVKGQDIKISLTVLPYVALNMIIKNYEGSRSHIQHEFMEILNTDNETFTHDVSKNIKLFYQTVFRIVDYLREWLASKKQKQHTRHRRKNFFGVTTEEGVTLVEEFLDSIPDLLVAKRASQSASYERAVLYLEQGYREDAKQTNETILSQLRDMYEKLNDYDALTGSLRQFSTANIRSAVSQLQYEDNWKTALGVFETIADSGGADIKYLQYLNKKNLHREALNKLECVLCSSVQNVPVELVNVALQCSVLECDADKLQKWVSIADIVSPINDSEVLVNVYISKSLLALKEHDSEGFQHNIDQCYSLIASSLSLSPVASLSRNKDMINKLHVLTDLCQLALKDYNGFHDRVENAGSDFESPWYIFTMRKTSLMMSQGSSEDISRLWLDRSRVEISHGRLDLAAHSVISLYVAAHNHDAELQYAEILWAQGDYLKALKIAHTLRSQKAEVQLKYACWLESSNNGLSTEIVTEFQKAIELQPLWEDPYYFLGKYYTKVLESSHVREDAASYEQKIIHNYLCSIEHGSKHLQEILPKIITLWLDFSSETQLKLQTLSDCIQTLSVIETEVARSLQVFPKYYWFAVFSQLLSRLPRTTGSTFSTVIDICVLVTQHYPEQALWAVFAQCNSGDAKRSSAGRKITSLFTKAPCKIQRYSSNKAIFNSAGNVFNAFKKMTRVEKARGLKECSLSEDFKFNHNVVPAPLVVPCKQNFEINSLSPTGFNYKNVTMVRFEDKVKIMASLQRPRRIEVLGSDGKRYFLLFKLNDDLRKDAKLMELTSMIDRLLQKNYESKKRNLHINTFAVVPLNESYGIIEWVQNHVTMKSILDRKYESKESLLHIKKQYDTKKFFVDKLSYFKHLLSYYQPVLYSWFIEFFPTPSEWYASRNSFVRTTAAMSMVGYILGIGDRHGENILISQTNGGVLHVDFDCLFEKGLILRIPERVPFRLTNNMVDAFGICGVEGTFRKSSEVTMQLMRNNEAILMNILEAFIHDPIMEWKNSKHGSPESTLAKTRSKIRGILEKEALPMSVSGQVNYLIKEATSSEHLCQMYFGWLPFW